MSQTPAERAREIVEACSEECPDHSVNVNVTKLIAAITAALTIPANHIRTHEGKDVKVLGTLASQITLDGVLCVGPGPFTLWYTIAGEPESGEFLAGAESISQALYSTREAALTSTPTP